MNAAARLQVEATLKGGNEIDPTHPLWRLIDELHVRPKDDSAAARAKRNATLLHKLLPGAPHQVDWLQAKSRADAVSKAELLLMAAKGAQQGLVTISVAVPQEEDGDAPDAFLGELRKGFLTPTEDVPDNATINAWNEQRALILKRMLAGLTYPKLATELLDNAMHEAHVMLAAECCARMHDHAFQSPYRIAPAVRQELKPGKKRKPPWVPNQHDYYERKARIVGATVLPSEEMGRGKGIKAGLVLVAIDENGTMVAHFKCRWLLTNIRARGSIRDQQGNSVPQPASCSALEVERKTTELVRLEDFLRDVGCEAVAIGAVDLQCRKFVDELNHVGFAMALRLEDEQHGDEMASQYYRAGRPLSDTPLERFPQITREQFESKLAFRAVLVDEAIPALWAATPAAASELPELDGPLRTALSSARMLQDPYAEVCHVIAPTALRLQDLPLHPMMAQLPEDLLVRGLVSELVDCACRLGIQVTDIMRHAHRSHMLQFVPGLGPRKAASLMRALQSRAANQRPIEARRELKDEELLGPTVWHNAAGFLVFDTARQHEPHKPPGLEGCRIHPEEYDHAQKICFDGVYDEDAEPEETEETLREAVDRAMGREAFKLGDDGVEILRLDELELDEFADHLRENEGARIGVETLTDIRSELAHPFRDTRGACGLRGPLNNDRLFELLTGETEATLRVGSLVCATVQRYETGRQLQEQYASPPVPLHLPPQPHSPTAPQPHSPTAPQPQPCAAELDPAASAPAFSLAGTCSASCTANCRAA